MGLASFAARVSPRRSSSGIRGLRRLKPRPHREVLRIGRAVGAKGHERCDPPLRGVRRALKPARPPVDEAAKEALRDAVKAVELQGERVLMESLEALSGPSGAPIPVLDGLVAAAEASGDPPRRAALEKLANALEKPRG